MKSKNLAVIAVIVAVIVGYSLMKLALDSEFSVFIVAPPNVVFEFMYDSKNLQRINPRIIKCNSSNYWTSQDGQQENVKWTLTERLLVLGLHVQFDVYVTVDRNNMLMAYRYNTFYALIRGHIFWSFEEHTEDGKSGTLLTEKSELKLARILHIIMAKVLYEKPQETLQTVKHLIEKDSEY